MMVERKMIDFRVRYWNRIHNVIILANGVNIRHALARAFFKHGNQEIRFKSEGAPLNPDGDGRHAEGYAALADIAGWKIAPLTDSMPNLNSGAVFETLTCARYIVVRSNGAWYRLWTKLRVEPIIGAFDNTIPYRGAVADVANDWYLGQVEEIDAFNGLHISKPENN